MQLLEEYLEYCAALIGLIGAHLLCSVYIIPQWLNTTSKSPTSKPALEVPSRSELSHRSLQRSHQYQTIPSQT